MRFAGFPERALVFYEGLEADNSKPYWTDHKAVYEECVRQPMEALLAELEAEFGAGTMFRPYRDVRFSKDKTPYKTAAGAILRGEGMFYVQLSAEGLFVGGGIYHAAPDQLRRLRRAVADNVHGEELERILASLRKAGYGLEGDVMKAMPRGYPADHPRAELLRHRSMAAWKRWEPRDWLHTRAALARVRTAWRAFRPLNGWMTANVGETEETRRT